MLKLKKILVPIDFSANSELAIAYATSLASEYNAQIHLLNVVEEEAMTAGIGGDPLNTVQRWKDQALKQLSNFVPEQFRDIDFIKQVRGGLVYEAIIEYAKEYEINLIVMGAHGKTGFIDSWLGGTTYEIARKAPCAVLTVKPDGRGFVDGHGEVRDNS
ncbi:MAG: universal stress protein [Candidatus Riflebacteria bacterium]|nr:universal stress protein [Candidatus Riflebacteria bacterium]